MTIQKKLILMSVGGMVPLVAITVVSFLAFDRVDPEKSAMVALSAAMSNQMRADMMHDALRAEVQRAELVTTGTDFSAIEGDVQKHIGTINDMFSKNLALPLPKSTLSIMAGLKTELDAYGVLSAGIVRAAHSDRKKVKAMKPAFDKAFSDLEDGMGKLDDLLEEQCAESQKAAASALATSRWTMLITGGLASLVLLLAGVLVSRSVNRTISKSVEGLSETAHLVTTAAGEIASGSQGVADGSASQASTLEELSASSEEISAMAQRNLHNCSAAVDSVQKSQTSFDAAETSIQDMMRAMTEINGQSDKISRIIKAIDAIAFQTNILALNAAVEAARAGDAGLGFAVVADEVRNLAQRSAQAASDTSGLIEESIQRSRDGMAKVTELVVIINNIVSEAGEFRELVESVKTGSEEQTRGIRQISQGIAQIQDVTQSTAASAEQSAATANELHSRSAGLLTVVGELKEMAGVA